MHKPDGLKSKIQKELLKFNKRKKKTTQLKIGQTLKQTLEKKIYK